MAAFQLGATAAAIVAENQALPQLTIVNLSSVGIVLFGREAVEQLRDACNAALDSADACTKPSRSQGAKVMSTNEVLS